MDAFVKLILSKTENELMEKCVWQWKIELPDLLSTRTTIFSPKKIVNTKFFFDIGFQRLGKGYITEKTALQIILRKLPESSLKSDMRFEFSISVNYSDGSLYKEYKSDSSVHLANFTEKTCINIYSDVCYRDKKYEGFKSAHGKKISTNVLTLIFRVKFFGQIIQPESYKKNEMDALHDFRILMKNFESLFQSNELSDVSIQIGDKTFKSHKFLLAAHSPVFKTMLMQDFQEAKTGVITISDFEPEIFESFLKFLYTGEVEDKSFFILKQLYILAEKYDIQILKGKYLKALTDLSLNEDQLDEVLEIAYQYNDVNLKKTAKQLLLNTMKKE